MLITTVISIARYLIGKGEHTTLYKTNQTYIAYTCVCLTDFVKEYKAMKMRCYRKILHISNNYHVTNEEVRAKIQQEFGPHEDLLTTVKRRNLQWNGHVSRSSCLAKTIL